MSNVNQLLRRLRGVIGIGLIWAPVWAGLFAALIAGIILVFNPSGGSDVGTLRMMTIIGWVGFVSGAIFGILLALAESGKPVRNLSLARAALWGILSSAVFPLLTQRANQILWTCVFGAVVAMTLVGLARRASLCEARQPKRLRDIFLSGVLSPVQDAVSPAQEPAT